MKNNILIICSLVLFLASCGDFLEYKDEDKVIPNKAEHYEELIFGELLMKSASSALVHLDLMTDDVEAFVSDEIYSSSSDAREKYFGYYTWSKEPQYDLNGSEVADKAWEFFYHKILMCNIIEQELTELEEEQAGMKERLLGEVQFMRALSYFYLVNMYGAPYENEAQAQTGMGVPINKEVGVYDKLYTRSSLQEVYKLMEDDLLAAKKNFENGEDKKSIFRPNLHATNILLSRLYLYKKRYQEAIDAANTAISRSRAIIEPLNNFAEPNHFYYRKNMGLVFTWGLGDNGPLYSDYYSAGRYIVSRELEKSYIAEDVRYNKFFEAYSGTLHSKKTSGNEVYRWGIRIEEAYLNRAEAYIELGKEWSKGVDDVNILRTNRIKNFTNKTINNQEDARDYYRQEKRLEFCFEDFRWFDIRRWGLEIIHRYPNYANKETYREFKLPKGSINYILPLPLEEQELNSHIERPERVDCEIKQ